MNKVSNKQLLRHSSQQRTPPTRKCKYCLKTHLMEKDQCPTYGQACSACKRRNHYKGSSVCGCHALHAVDCWDKNTDDSNSELSTIGSITIAEVSSTRDLDGPLMCKMNVNGKPVRIKVDCCATMCVLSKMCTLAGLYLWIWECGTLQEKKLLEGARSVPSIRQLVPSTRLTFLLWKGTWLHFSPVTLQKPWDS